ncbi:unnamed protein product [Amoebophrya sp. A120]|nr:unnamed protein product [Amoebophrya sp. A120]|eukprot:GSA120T00024967001.1
MLREQYRMPRKLCNLVSTLFYDSKLITPAAKVEKLVPENQLRWVDCGREDEMQVGTSYVAPLQVVAAVCLLLGHVSCTRSTTSAAVIKQKVGTTTPAAASATSKSMPALEEAATGAVLSTSTTAETPSSSSTTPFSSEGAEGSSDGEISKSKSSFSGSFLEKTDENENSTTNCSVERTSATLETEEHQPAVKSSVDFLSDAKAEVMIICMYLPQMRLLRAALPASLLQRPGFRIVTVDAAQGTEADHVVLIAGRCNPWAKVGFTKVKNRLNVAISRAKQSLTVIGCEQTMRSDRNWRQLIESCTPFDWPAAVTCGEPGLERRGNNTKAGTGFISGSLSKKTLVSLVSAADAQAVSDNVAKIMSTQFANAQSLEQTSCGNTPRSWNSTPRNQQGKKGAGKSTGTGKNNGAQEGPDESKSNTFFSFSGNGEKKGKKSKGKGKNGDKQSKGKGKGQGQSKIDNKILPKVEKITPALLGKDDDESSTEEPLVSDRAALRSRDSRLKQKGWIKVYFSTTEANAALIEQNGNKLLGGAQNDPSKGFFLTTNPRLASGGVVYKVLARLGAIERRGFGKKSLPRGFANLSSRGKDSEELSPVVWMVYHTDQVKILCLDRELTDYAAAQLSDSWSDSS